MTWTEEQIRKAIEMDKDGHSRTTIGRAVGKSRNAVIGKLNRLKAIGDDRISVASTREKFSDEKSLYILDRHENHSEAFGTIAKAINSSSIQVEQHYRELIRDIEESEGA